MLSQIKLKILVFILTLIMIVMGQFSVFANYSISRFNYSWCTTSYPTSYVTGSWSITETEYNGNGGMNGLTKNQNNKTILIDLPSGFEFKTTGYIATITASGTEVNGISFVFTSATTLKVTLSTDLAQTEFNTLYFNNFEIRATSAASGNMIRNGGTFKIDNMTSNPSSSEPFGVFIATSPFTYTGSACMHPYGSTDSIGQYSINNQMMRIKISGTGNCGSAVTSFTLNTDGGNGTGTDSVRSISNVKIYYTGSSTTFSTTNLFGSYSTPSGSFTVNGSQTVSDGDNYFFVTYDIRGDAYTGSDGNKVDVQLTNFVLGGTTKTDMTTPAPTGYRIIKASKKYYSIVSSGNWNSSSTWSLTDNGPSCSCQPNGSGIVVIDTNNTIAANAARIVDVIEIYNGGTLATGAAAHDITVKSFLVTYGSGKFTLNQPLYVYGNVELNGTGFSSGANNIDINGDLKVGSGTKLSGTSASVGNDIFVGGNLTIDGTIEQTGFLTITMDGGYYTLAGTGTVASGTITIKGGNKTIPASANLTVTPNFTIDGPYTVTNNGTVTINGNLDATDASANWTNAASSTLKYGGTQKMFYNYGTLTATANSNTVEYSGNSAQEILAPDYAQFWHFKLSGTGSKTLIANISVKGNWINNSTFIGSGLTITFNGTMAQSIEGSSVTTFPNLVINNTSATGVYLNKSAIVSASLTLTDGLVYTTSTELLTLNDNATSSNGKNASYVSGPMKKIGNDAFKFPVGKGGYWARIGISAPATVTSEFTAEYFNTAYSSLTPITAPLIDVSYQEYWQLDRAVTSDAVNVTIHWEDTVRSYIRASRASELVVARWNGASWNSMGNSSYSAGATGYVNSNSSSDFGTITFGDLWNSLPVELLSFTGKAVDDGVLLEWKTASELNNDYFTIERSADSYDWEIIGKVNGNGTTNEFAAYEFLDENPITGINYYRLKQTDYDGAYEEFDVIAVNFSANGSVSIFNKVDNSGLVLHLTNCTSDAFVHVYETSGKLLENRVLKSGTTQVDLDLKSYGSGTYVVQVLCGTVSQVKKVIIH